MARVSDKPALDTVDQLLGLSDGTVGPINLGDLSAQMVGSGPVGDALGGKASVADIAGLEQRVSDQEALGALGAQFAAGGPVACATTADITLSGEQTLDGVQTSASRVLVKDQADPAQNGIYISAEGTWSRAPDMDTASEAVSTAVYVIGGATQAGRSYATYSTVVTLDSDPVIWRHVSTSAPTRSLDDIEANFWAAAEKRRADVRARVAAKTPAAVCPKAGQSLANKRATGTVIHSAPGHLMFNGGPYTNDFQHASVNETHTAAQADMASLVQYSESDGQEGLNRADGIVLAGHFDLVASFSAAIGARTLDALFNGGPRNNLMGALERMCDLVEAQDGGRYAAKPIWDFAQGEANAAAGTVKAVYDAEFASAIIDMRCFSAWAIDDLDYIAPIGVHQMMQSDLTEAFHEIIQAQQDVVLRTPLCEFVTAAYPYPHEADEVHPTGEAYALKSEYSKLRLLEMLAGAPKVGSPVCSYATRSGAVIRALVATAGGLNLASDPDVDFARGIDGATELLGFQFYRNGALVDLTGATLTIQGRTLVLTLASDPGAVQADEELRYAMQEDASAMEAGGHLRSGGNVKSLDPAYASSVMTMQRFTFTNGITVVGGSGDGPGGRTITGLTSGATALVHSVKYSSGSFDTDDAQGEFTAYRVTGTFVDGEVVETGAIDMTLSGAPVEEPFQHENWLTRFAVPVTAAAE